MVTDNGHRYLPYFKSNNHHKNCVSFSVFKLKYSVIEKGLMISKKELSQMKNAAYFVWQQLNQ